jgi:hypothetical protein
MALDPAEIETLARTAHNILTGIDEANLLVPIREASAAVGKIVRLATDARMEAGERCAFGGGCEYLPSSIFHSPCANGCTLPKGHAPARSCHTFQPGGA